MIEVDRYWQQIHAFVADLGESRNLDEFAGQALANIGSLIPFDANAMFIKTDRSGRVLSWRTLADCSEWLGPFNDYYCERMPVIDQDVVAVDWNSFQCNEFANDFAKPQGMRHSLGIFRSGSATHDGVVFTLHRSRHDRPFSDSEILISNVLQNHLFNLHNLYSRLEETSSSGPDPLEIAQRFGSLTRREVEITALLCRRLSTSAIASKLLISRLTVYKHVENIFDKLGINSREELLDRFSSRDSA